jgi:hypothetical protein
VLDKLGDARCVSRVAPGCLTATHVSFAIAFHMAWVCGLNPLSSCPLSLLTDSKLELSAMRLTGVVPAGVSDLASLT